MVLREDTDYPFRETIRFTVEKAAGRMFPLRLRIPAWAPRATVTFNGKPAAKAPQAGTFYALAQTWQAGDVVELRLPMDVRVLARADQVVSVERGPLVYALKIGEAWTTLRNRPNADDYEVRATTPWNYGLLLGPQPATAFTVYKKPLTGVLFSPEGAPVELRVQGVRLPRWQLAENSAGPVPASPVARPAGAQPELLTLISYGAAKLRITVFPVVR